MSNDTTPMKLTTALREAKWWPEFISVKDDFSWETLAKRFNTHAHLLRRAAKEAGVEKKALPPGGLRVTKAEEAPVAKAAPVTMTDLSPEGRIGAVSDRIGALSDADVASWRMSPPRMCGPTASRTSCRPTRPTSSSRPRRPSRPRP